MATVRDSDRVRAMAMHVKAICAYHGIRILPGRKGLAVYATRTIHIRGVRSDVTYAEALHEIGHLLGAWQDAGVIVSESGAWLWAMRNALEWTPAMERAMIRWLGSYVETQHEHPQGDGVPARGHPAWKVLSKTGAMPQGRRGRSPSADGALKAAAKRGGKRSGSGMPTRSWRNLKQRAPAMTDAHRGISRDLDPRPRWCKDSNSANQGAGK